MEQVFMDIAITEEDFRRGETTHQELHPTVMLSDIAQHTPFSDFNQSPRNMYQCQMGKQTMGTPFHSYPYRVDNKVYRLQTPQRPIVHNQSYDTYDMDEYPIGTNAIVAVHLMLTGYDMEDAMIINKAAYERGFMHASVYKFKRVDLSEKRDRGMPIHDHFNNIEKESAVPSASALKKSKKEGKDEQKKHVKTLDKDGTPFVGQKIAVGSPLYVTYNDAADKFSVVKNKDSEDVYIDQVYALGPESENEKELQQLGLKLRINRNPVIGDKFSSRHGQKGVLSVLYPQENMPFTESGMTPDIIINPHAFPSRMTIGMLIESLAGKAGACHGIFQDATPFQFDEKRRAVDYFGQQLVAAGYNYMGTEPLYSGITGTELQAEIYIGVVYYQRLRHMVSDKAQVRATGPVNQLYRQPIKGRKVHGGIRFGEMERDSLLAHGAAFLLHDRLMNCSDYHTAHVCTLCGSLLSPVPVGPLYDSTGQSTKVVCRNCNTGKGCSLIAVPYVFVYLANELAAMNIRLTLSVR